MTTPQERLSSTRWRLLNSSWVLTPLLSLGTFTFAAFFYAGSRMRSRPVLLWSVGYALFTVFLFSVIETSPPDRDRAIDNIAFALLLAVWIGGSLQAFRVNRQFLLWKARRASEGPWYQHAAATTAPPPASGDAVGRTGLLDDQQALWGAGPAAPAPAPPQPPSWAPRPPAAGLSDPLDLNTAREEQLQAVPGIGPILAKRIVSERQTRGGFRAVEDLSAILPPHVLVRLRDLVVVAAPRAEPARPPRGRVIDL